MAKEDLSADTILRDLPGRSRRPATIGKHSRARVKRMFKVGDQVRAPFSLHKLGLAVSAYAVGFVVELGPVGRVKVAFEHATGWLDEDMLEKDR